jgi:CubicO group peptidase (beta-lactamase class C family)
MKELKNIVEKARLKFNLPAVSVTILNSNEIYLSEIQGVRIHGKNNEVSIDNYFHIGSCSKSILAIIAAKLIEENKINWSTNFFDVYPEMKEYVLKDYRNINLEDLFLCRAGIKAYTSGDEVFPELDLRRNNIRYDFAKWLIQQKPESKFQDGKFEFLYSNAGYTMVSLMLERVSGKSYDELIKTYVIDAMGIETFIGFPNRYDSNQPWGHTISQNGIEIFDPDNAYILPELLIPAGDLSMKPLGFAKYIQLNLQGLNGIDNFINADSYKYVHFAHKGFSIGVFNSKMFGYIFSGMDGSAGTFFCRAILVPEIDFAFTIMTNAGSGSGQMKAVDWITMKIVKKQYHWWWKFWM